MICEFEANKTIRDCMAPSRALTPTAPVSRSRRDWFAVLRDLAAAGVSMSAVARTCGRDVGAVRNWAAGGEPKESDARVVLALYAKYCAHQYLAHQRQFDIRIKIEATPSVGETRLLPLL